MRCHSFHGRPYRAPGLAPEAPASSCTDAYALGVLLFQVAAGDLELRPGPFWERHVDDPLLREKIAALLEPSPDKRFDDLAEVARRLRGLPRRRAEMAERDARVRTDEARRREQEDARLRRLKLALAGISLLALLALALLAAQL